MPFSFSTFILCGLGYAFAVTQLLGFLGIFKEKPALFRRYVAINWILLYVGLSVAATFLGISAARHSQAVTTCESTFFSDDSTSTTEDTKGQEICNIFCWVNLGVMGALWVLIFIVQVRHPFSHFWLLLLIPISQTYFVLVLRNYGVSQRADHTKYHSIYSAHDGGDNIMLNNIRSGVNGEDEAWGARPSTDSWHPRAAHGYRDEESTHYQIPPPEKGAGYGVSMDPIPPPEKGTGYGVGMGSVPLPAGPSKQASVDQAYLEHPSKAEEAAAPLVPSKSDFQGGNYYDPQGAPPSYHGHDSEYPQDGMPRLAFR